MLAHRGSILPRDLVSDLLSGVMLLQQALKAQPCSRPLLAAFGGLWLVGGFLPCGGPARAL